MIISRPIAAAVALLFSAGTALAAPVDLTGWTSEGQGNWVVSAAKDSVTHTINGEPTVFYSPGSLAQGNSLRGQIRDRGGDDDFIGFVLGFDAGELSSSNADFWLIDWKQGNQNAYGAYAPAGLALSHVTGDLSTGGLTTDFWGHSGRVSQELRATNLGSTGYANNVFYEFDLTFTSTLIEVKVGGVTELSLNGSFGNGGFGFYNFSQDPVDYAGITSAVVPSVPLPAGLPILLSAFGVFGLVGRRRKAA